MDHLGLYADFLKRHLKTRRKLRVVFDCSNGTTGIILSKLLKAKSSKLKAWLINDKPDGRFPAHGPNPMTKGAMKQLEREVNRRGADLGVIFDADGDRVFFVDNRGRQVDPNEVGYILMQETKPPYVVGVTSSWRLKRPTTNNRQPTTFISKVGHYYFKKLMKEKKANLGVEHSGHYYFLFKFGKEIAYFDSGILGAIKVMNFVSELDTDLASWLDALSKYYRSGEINFETEDKAAALKAIEKKYARRAEKISKLDGLTIEFADYWFNVRPSNTENFLRLNMEAISRKVLKEKLKEIKRLLVVSR